jgi:glutathione reductase (NADPH)
MYSPRLTAFLFCLTLSPFLTFQAIASSRYIIVDEYSKTNVDNIYAVGDITDRLALTPVALMEGMAVARHLFSGIPHKADHKNVPTAVFSQPNIGTVGYSEEEAVEAFGDVDVYSSSFRPMRNTISGNETRGFMKILVDPKTDKVLGVHMVGSEAGEIMQVQLPVLAADISSVVV